MNISLVPHGNIAQLIPALWPYLAESEAWTRGRATVDDILRFVFTGQMHLWAVHDEGSIMGHIVTEIKEYPRCKMLVIQYCAMEPGTLEKVDDQMQTLAHDVAVKAGCAGIEFVGRPGWRNVAKKHGYAVQSVVYQKFLKGA